MHPRPYYSDGGASAAFYDVMTAADGSLAGDINLYASLIPEAGTVLELGSGTGRVSEALARRGFDVVGLELSAAMLKQAEARKPNGLKLRYQQGDMCSFELGRTFDAVICPFYALAHLPPADWPRIFETVARHLIPSGLAAFHLPVAEKMAAPAPPSGAPVFRRDALTVFMGGKTYDEATGQMDLDLTYSIGPVTSTERLTLFAGDPAPAAYGAGLALERPLIPLGADGFVHVFRR